MKVLDNKQGTLNVQISEQEFLVLLSAMGYVSSEYDALDTLRLGFSEADGDAVSVAMYDILKQEYDPLGTKRAS